MKISRFKFTPFSKKQKQVLTWWCPDSPHKDKDVLICDGAVRAGKTIIMSLSFIIWAMETFIYKNFGMAGKTIGSFRRNVLLPLKVILFLRGYKVHDHRSESYITVKRKGVENYFYIFGGKDERSQDLVQGFTSAGFFFDEVALMPQSFVNQAVARCSVEGRKLWFNCNPDGPFHWFKLEWLDKQIEKNALHIHFLLDDNPSLSEKTKQFYRRMFTGVFFKRFILGLWVVAEGIIYDMFSEEENEYDDGQGPNYDLFHRRYYTIDYGTINPCVFLEIIEQHGIYFVEDEYYYNSKEKGRQKDDGEYVEDLLKFIDNKPYRTGIIDPSAASFKVAARKKGIKLMDADNDVEDGIRLVAHLMALRRLKVNRTKCRNFLKERASYIWNDKKAMEHGKEEPMKENDHAMDATRYFCKTIVKWVRNWNAA